MLAIVPFTAEWSAEVREFNRRLTGAGLDPDLCFPEQPRAEFPTSPEAPLYQEFFLAVQERVVRGAYFLTHEPWRLAGELHMLANYRLPLSEGLIDPAYRGVNLLLLRDALERNPLMYCLGMSSFDRPLPRTLRTLKWPMCLTPFFFLAVRPFRVLRNLRVLRGSALRRLAAEAASFSGAGWVSLKLAQALRRRGGAPEFSARVTPEFEPWADALWEQVGSAYETLAVRDRRLLNLRYPPGGGRFIRLVVYRGDDVLGWAVLLVTPMRRHRHFGDLRVGTVVDVLAAPGDADAIVRAAVRELGNRGVDLMVTNHTHAAWCAAFRRAGFLEGPSNRIFAASPRLAAYLEPFTENLSRLHLTRGDAAGPVHL